MAKISRLLIACLAVVLFVTTATNLVFAANSRPKVGTITPSSGTSYPNQQLSFSTTYSDLDGWQNIRYVHLLINTTTRGKNCFYGYYNQNTNKIYLRNDTNRAWLGGFSPGSNYIIENSYAKLDCSKTTFSGSGNTLTVKWSITFKSTFLGTKNSYLYVKDDANAYSGWVKKGTWTIKADTTPPQGTIKINNDAVYTNSTQVTLNLSATDTASGMAEGSQMQFSNDNTDWSTPEAYATTKAWTLTDGDGTKTAYVKYKDAGGNWSTAYSDTIVLDTTPPVIIIISPEDGSILSLPQVTLEGIVDGVPFQEIRNLAHGTNILTKELTDEAGNRGSASVTVIYNIAPTITNLIPQNNSSFTETDLITIQVIATDPDNDPLQYQYYVDNTIKQTWSSNSTYPWQTKDGDNNGHIIKVEVKDPFGATVSKQNSIYIFRKPISPPQR